MSDIASATLRERMDSRWRPIAAVYPREGGEHGLRLTRGQAPHGNDSMSVVYLMCLRIAIKQAAKELEFEKAAKLRDRIKLLRDRLVGH